MKKSFAAWLEAIAKTMMSVIAITAPAAAAPIPMPPLVPPTIRAMNTPKIISARTPTFRIRSLKRLPRVAVAVTGGRSV